MVNVFRQALALDERRAKFRHNPWSNVSDPLESNHALYQKPYAPRKRLAKLATKVKAPHRVDHPLHRLPRPRVHRELVKKKAKKVTYWTYERRQAPTSGLGEACELCPASYKVSTDSREVWFAGSHSGKHIGILSLGIPPDLLAPVHRCRRTSKWAASPRVKGLAKFQCLQPFAPLDGTAN